LKNFLEKITSHKTEEVKRNKALRSEKDLAEMAGKLPPPLSLQTVITEAHNLAVIAEIKKASPSAGVIRKDFNPAQFALEYQQAGAVALSILTDQKFFQGSLSYLRKIRGLVDIPLLRKDFIIEPYQVLEARAFGADAVLLIMSVLDLTTLPDLLSVVKSLGLEALVEVHNEKELENALRFDINLIGINNRDLETFKVDLTTTEQLASKIPEDIIAIAESGIHSPSDACRMFQSGIDALLIGTSFMKQPSPGKALSFFKKEIEKCSV
jgi:indole-3-glycerol phosphate synthase